MATSNNWRSMVEAELVLMQMARGGSYSGVARQELAARFASMVERMAETPERFVDGNMSPAERSVASALRISGGEGAGFWPALDVEIRAWLDERKGT